MNHRTWILGTVVVCSAVLYGGAETKASAPKSEGSSYLFVWTADAAHQNTDFLSVLDANPASPDYGRIVRTLPIGAGGTKPHHTELEFPPDNLLFANSWVAGRTYVFDLNRSAGTADRCAIQGCGWVWFSAHFCPPAQWRPLGHLPVRGPGLCAGWGPGGSGQ